MTPKPTGWDELHLAENPAVELLESLGYTYLPSEDLEPERASPKEAILTGRPEAAARRGAAAGRPGGERGLIAHLRQQQPAVVIVTDRTKLDRQIAGVFQACGFPNPEGAVSVRGLRRILEHPTGRTVEHPTGRTVMTTIQKFQEVTGAGSAAQRAAVHPTLSEAANIFVMVDEAHRTQYRSLAANMRQALPNACFLGFTGTPIDKKDRSTLRTFGPYIDTYTIEQAVRDRATVPIFYESRLPELQIIGQTLDQVFDRVFADRTEDERAAIRQRFATEQAVAGAPRRIEAVCLDLIEHFTRFIAAEPVQGPGGGDEPPRRGHLQGDAGPAERPRVGPHHVGGPQRRGAAGALAPAQGRAGPGPSSGSRTAATGCPCWSSATCCSPASTRRSSR